MALTPTATTEIAQVPQEGGGSIGFYRVDYTVNGAAINEALTQLVGVANGLPAGMTVLAWTNAAVATSVYPNDAGTTMAYPILDQVAQVLHFVLKGTGALAALVADVGASTAGRAIVLARQD